MESPAQPIALTGVDQDNVQVVAEMIAVLDRE